MSQLLKNKHPIIALLAFFIVGCGLAFVGTVPASAASSAPVKTFAADKLADPINVGDSTTNNDTCGSGPNAVHTSIDLGCKGQGNPIADAAFAIIRFLSYGVGLVIVASLTYAGILYTSSRDDPKAVAAARSRIYANVIALLLFIFGFAVLNYLIPAGFFK